MLKYFVNWFIFLIGMSSISLVTYASPVMLDIPSTPLSVALDKVAQSMGLEEIDHHSVQLPNQQVAALKGQYEAKAVLAQLLDGSGMTAVETGQNRYVIKLAQAENKKPDISVTTTMPEVTVSSTVESRSPYNKDFIRPNNSTATKTDTPIMKTPFSVQVVPRQVLQDQQVVRLTSAVQNVSGVSMFPGSVSGQDGFIIRGFETSMHFRNGASMPRNNNNRTEVANIEQIEILKGPGSILFGRADPGGIVNTVTKQPLATSYYSLQQQAGSFGFYRTAVDAGGPLTKDDTLLYRLNLSYENSDSFRDTIDYKSVFIAPVFRWNISPDTQLTVEMEYQTINNDVGFKSVHLNGRPAPIPRNRILSEPTFSDNKGDRYFAGANWSHRFNENWEVKHQFYTERTNIPKYRGVIPTSAVDVNGNVSRFLFDTTNDIRRYHSALNLIGDVTTGPLKHTLLFGYDYFHQSDKFDDQVCCPRDTINVFNPVYFSALPAAVSDPSLDSPASRTSQEWHGAYFQDQVELPFNLHMLAGFRYDYAVNRNKVTNTTTSKDDRFSPRGGLLWNPIPWLSVYGSYTENFGIANRLNVNGEKLRPQTAQQWEVGAKTEFFDGRFRSTFSYFELTRQNIAVPNPIDPRFSRASGEAESRGFEFDVAGEVIPGLNMIATYSYLPFAEITKDVGSSGLPGDTGNQGNQLFLAAKHSGSFWSSYEFQHGWLRGLRIAGGIQAIGERFGNAANTHKLPYFVIGNLMTSYQFTVNKMRVTAQLNVNNVSNEEYFPGARNNGISVGAPRIFMGMLRIEH